MACSACSLWLEPLSPFVNAALRVRGHAGAHVVIFARCPFKLELSLKTTDGLR